jgi:dipeptidyl aminopeptidase/acylaminoacyl peptidase
LRIWDPSGKELSRIKTSGNAFSASFSGDGARIVAALLDGTVRIWETATGRELLTLRGHGGAAVNAVSFSPDGTQVVTASHDQTARVWDAETGREIAVLKGHTLFLRAAVFSPDGQRVVTSSIDRTVRIWNAKTGMELVNFTPHDDVPFGVSFSPDGKFIVTTAADNTARIWDELTLAKVSVLKGHTSVVFRALFSPDGKRVVTASADKTARVWDTETGVELAVLVGHSSNVSSACFSPDGDRVLTASWDHSLRLWDVSRSSTLCGDRAVVLAAALVRTAKERTKDEASDLLMQEAPEDLYGELLKRLDDRRVLLPAVAAGLRAPLHPNCYLSPSMIGATSKKEIAACPVKRGEEVKKHEMLLRVTLGAKGQFDHYFGHDPELSGLIPKGRARPAHLVLTLDTSDPLLSRFELGQGSRLRLVHPYVYDSSGESFAYRQSDNRIEFLRFASKFSKHWPYDDYPTQFTRIPATLEVEAPPAGELKPDFGTDGNGKGGNLTSPYTFWYAAGRGEAIFLGPLQKTIQDPGCECPVCSKDVPLLARVPDAVQGAKEQTWGDSGVYTLFWYCANCALVISRNEV